MTTALYEARKLETPPLPRVLAELSKIHCVENPGKEDIVSLFPNLAKFTPNTDIKRSALKVGVVLSGGQAAGGHNVICGLHDALVKLHPDSKLIGFLGGPAGILKNNSKDLTTDFVKEYLNTGGFDMIGSGRDKIETTDQFKAALQTVKAHELDALIIIGGDDSNTNAALLAEFFLESHQPTAVIGVPKTIDGDLKNQFVEQSFGFDTASRVYSEIVGNLLKDALSAKKYWFFIRLMGRTASHLTMETALQTQPNLTLISEERRTLDDIVDEIVTLIESRSKKGKNYGAILIPEGIIEFIPSLPKNLLEGTSLDPHGNLEVSKIETEKLLIELVKKKLSDKVPFSPLAMFLGYEGRSAYPSHFDATYCYALGYTAALLASIGATGHMATVTHLSSSVEYWSYQGVPLIGMLHLEERKGVMKPVIKKALVDIQGSLYNKFKALSRTLKEEDHYLSPGPIQFWGPSNVVDTRAISLKGNL